MRVIDYSQMGNTRTDKELFWCCPFSLRFPPARNYCNVTDSGLHLFYQQKEGHSVEIPKKL